MKLTDSILQWRGRHPHWWVILVILAVLAAVLGWALVDGSKPHDMSASSLPPPRSDR